MGVGFGTDLLSNLAAGKPTIPNLPALNFGTEQATATAENEQNLPGLETLASQTNAFNQEQLDAMLQAAIPGYESLKKQGSDVISSELSGQLPKDVQTAIESSDAARALTGGFAGTNLAGNLTARDLGLTSLQLTQQGLSSAQSWLSSIKAISTPGLFDFSNMFITPQQQAQFDVEERNSQFQRNYVSNLNDWQHSFGTALAQDIQDTAGTVLSYYTGGAGGGNRSGSWNSGGGGSGGIEGGMAGADVGSMDAGVGGGAGASAGASFGGGF